MKKFIYQQSIAIFFVVLVPYFPNKLHKLMLLTYTEAA